MVVPEAAAHLLLELTEQAPQTVMAERELLLQLPVHRLLMLAAVAAEGITR
jgi:hypothetical protein